MRSSPSLTTSFSKLKRARRFLIFQVESVARGFPPRDQCSMMSFNEPESVYFCWLDSTTQEWPRLYVRRDGVFLTREESRPVGSAIKPTYDSTPESLEPVPVTTDSILVTSQREINYTHISKYTNRTSMSGRTDIL